MRATKILLKRIENPKGSQKFILIENSDILKLKKQQCQIKKDTLLLSSY